MRKSIEVLLSRSILREKHPLVYFYSLLYTQNVCKSINARLGLHVRELEIRQAGETSGGTQYIGIDKLV